ncbi:MAG: Gfo/Idh/MocA family oxidoreductase [Chloroflexi bacterium]|nr:Gfo/Idh/MocA family oxidoreductase [Chloroflexota bacterium]
MEEKVRVAVVGAGGIGGIHLRAYAQSGRAEIVAVADVVPEAARTRAEAFGCRAYTDYREMFDREVPQAISVCTPPVAHREVTEAALARGLAVLCEKPLARTVEEARAMVEAADRTGGILMTALCHRFHPAVRTLREMIAAGRLGRIVHFHNRFAFRFVGVERTWFVQPEVAGGGILIDTAVHSVDLFRFLVGEVESAWARLQTVLPELTVEDSAVLHVRSVDGVDGVIECSWVTPVSEAAIWVYGTEGEAIVDYAAAELRYRLEGDDDWTHVPDEGPDRFAGEVTHFLDCVASGTRPMVDGRDGLRALEILAAGYRSVETGCVEMVGD